ncbi:carboxylate-amine ligase [Planosporangium mesophilum]|uniref:Putative glutamate--cysteine ligase 2 n=1 Tax=Planosporangium mesophilum TaxID=689768 RepID=A0A8J3X0R6_9ACTN|nr:glutamate--cysteine ligase [Planosporangium mesophilum]NJC86150.1 glutamate--cysteine ligase [Planosporangium mesophilum]GII23001.1 putative glutamate--cysteine ligase 2 [Planosporangium mesophilum]
MTVGRTDARVVTAPATGGSGSRPVVSGDSGDSGNFGDPAAPLTLGVEEEYLLVDLDSATAVARVDEVEAALEPDVRSRVSREFHASQIEVATTVHTDLAALRAELVDLRRSLTTAAVSVGCRILAVGTAVIDGPPPPVTDDSRYARMAERFGAIADTPGLCGCHVHVGVPDRELAVQVCNHLRPWLPTLQAMTANSPFYAGRDTGHASWRSILWTRWPSTGPTPHFRDLAEYRAAVECLVPTGVMLDEGMIYWYARPSANYPTVEVRIGDVCATPDDTVLVAALVRALVASIIADIEDGRDAPRVPDELLKAAHWRAAHDGLEGGGVDARTGTVHRAWDLLDRLIGYVEPALVRHGDLGTVTRLVELLRQHGSGAARQHRARHDDGLGGVLALLARQTTDGLPGR